MDESLIGVADIHSLAGDGESLVDKAQGWITKGIPLGLASGVTSVLNTGISFGNMFGDFEQINLTQKIREYDDDLGKYYEENKERIDLGGFIGTSLVPGTLGLKALKALQTVKTGEGIGGTTYTLAGYFAGKQEKYLKAAAETVQSPTNQLFGIIDKNKIKAIAAGFGEQGLQGAVFETAVLLSMNQNPILEPTDRNYVQNIIYHLPQAGANALLFAGVGGVLGAAGVTGKINKLIVEQDIKDFPHMSTSMIGLNDLPAGTQAVFGYTMLQDAKAVLEQMKKIEGPLLEGETALVTPRAIKKQEEFIKNYRDEFSKFVTEKLVDKENIDLAQQLLKNIDELKPIRENGFPIEQSEALARILGAAKKIGRLEDEIVDSTKSKDGNLLLDENRIPQRIMKIAGENKGAILESAYPAAGDLGKVRIDETGLYINDKFIKVAKDYDPAVNSPTESSHQFLLAHASKEPIELKIPSTNLPAIEAALLRGERPEITGYKGFQTELPAILRELKIERVTELSLLGKDQAYISRALNVSRAFLEDSMKGATILGSVSERAIEDLTKPNYAKIVYTGIREDAKYYAEGMRHLTARVQLSQAQRENAAAYIFGENFFAFPQSKDRLPATPTISGAASFGMSSDGARGSVMMNAMQSGKMVDKLSKEQVIAWDLKLRGLIEEIKADPKSLYTRNLTATTIRSSGEDMIRVPAELHFGGIETELLLVPRSVLKKAIKEAGDPEGEFEGMSVIEILEDLIGEMGEQQIVRQPIKSAEARFLIARQELTSDLAKKQNMAFAARGKITEWSLDSFYEPPIDTKKQPFFVLVSHNNPFDDVRPYSMVVAQSAESLAQKVNDIKAKLGDLVDVYSKKDIETNKKLQGLYDPGLLFGKTAVDSELKKHGILSDFIPRKDDYIFAEHDAWAWSKAQGINRQGVELLYGSEMAELRFLEANWNKDYSRFGPKAVETAQNPYTQVINTYLNISNKGTYSEVWGKINDAAQSAYGEMTGAYEAAFKAANEGKLSPEAANAIAKKAGYSNAAESVSREIFNETFKDNNSLSKLVSKINLATGTLMIRMDPLNSLINIMSLPVLFAAETSASRREIMKKLEMNVQVPGTEYSIPSSMKLLMDGTRAWWNKKELVEIGGQQVTFRDWFNSIGANRTVFEQLMDSVAIPVAAVKSPNEALAYASNLTKKTGDFGARVSGNDFAEEFVRFQAAYAGFQLAKAQGITSAGDLAAYANMMINRVHGNYLASQRPTIFSGPVGQAISLFQTYQFNMIQQMTRYLQEGNYKSVALAMGMQNTIFGMQSNPLFWQLNKYIGDSNSKHEDLVTGTSKIVGMENVGWKDPARWMLYGLGANSLQVNLYNRGDLTPRYTTIVPTDFADIPAISIGTKAIGSFLNTVKNIANGAPVPESILHGISHAGFNRPLAGLASLAAGGKTTNQGTLLAAYNDIDSFGVAAKIAGGEPLNNAVTIDAYYRLQGYRSTQAKQMADLAESVKLVTAGGEIDPEQMQEFMNKYAAKGGDMKLFNRFIMTATKNANQSIVNRMKQKTANPLAARQLGWLGADLPDNYNTSLDPEDE